MKLELGGIRSEPARAIDPRRYHEAADPKRPPIAERLPVCLYLEVTNRCNLLCTTCPRTYEALEPPADMSWDLFTGIVDQVPDLARAVLHGIGEPMLVKSLPLMVRHLKERGVYVLFNTNGTALNERNGRALIEAGLDELRVSLDAATRESFRAVRGVDVFDRILRNVRRFRDLQGREGAASPRVSLWLTGLKETLAELPTFVRLAGDMGVSEVYLQRLVFFDVDPVALARPDQTLFGRLEKDEAAILAEAEAEARRLGITFSASGAASEPGMSLMSMTRGESLVALRPAVDAHVLHRQRAGAALLHRPIRPARLRELYARRRDLGTARCDLERRPLSDLSCSPPIGPAAARLRKLRLTLEPVRHADRRRRVRRRGRHSLP